MKYGYLFAAFLMGMMAAAVGAMADTGGFGRDDGPVETAPKDFFQQYQYDGIPIISFEASGKTVVHPKFEAHIRQMIQKEFLKFHGCEKGLMGITHSCFKETK